MNNPLKYTDGNGYWFGIDDLIGAAIGGIINLGSNLLQGHVHNFWQGLAAFGAGAAAGDLALYGPAGWAAGGAITGSTNAWLGGATGWNIAKGGAMGAIGGLAGGAGSALSSMATQPLGAIAGAFQGAVTGAITGGLAGGVAGGINNVLFGGGSFDDGFWAGFKSGALSGGIMGGIGGGITGYQNAVKAGANPWTGYRVDNPRTYGTQYGDPSAFHQPDQTRDCAAYNAAYSNLKDRNPGDYIMYEHSDGGSGMLELAQAYGNGARGNYSMMSDINNFDQLGGYMDQGYSLYATSGAHNYTILQYTVSDKMNLFFGGTHQVVSNVSVFNSLHGNIEGYSGSWGLVTWIKW